MSTSVRLGVGGAVLALVAMLGASGVVAAQTGSTSDSISADGHWCC
jgi:hypothetical protein